MKPYVLNNVEVFNLNNVTSNHTSKIITTDQMSVVLFHYFVSGGNGTLYFEATNFPIDNTNVTPQWYQHWFVPVTGSDHSFLNPTFLPFSSWRVRWQHSSGSVTLRIYLSARAF